MVTTFRKRRGLLSFMKTPARTVTISSPVMADKDVPMWEAREYLHDKVYDFMKGIADSVDNYEYIRYEKNTDLSASVEMKR
jgi:hypothetical protein